MNSDINVDKGKADHLNFDNGFFDLENKTHRAGKTQFNLKKDNFGNPKNDPRIVGMSSSSSENKTIIKKEFLQAAKKKMENVLPGVLRQKKSHTIGKKNN